MKQKDMTEGPVTKSLLSFALPMILGNLLQQMYNVADTLIVGRYLGSGALAAVGSSFTLMTFLTSILLGLCMGSGIYFSMLYGAKEEEKLKSSLFVAFVFIGVITLVINVLVIFLLNPIMSLLQIPGAILADTKDYLKIIFYGISFTFLYNYFAALLRSVGNSVMPLICLAVSAVLNIGLDLFFILKLGWGVEGAAAATIIAQGVSAVILAVYCLAKVPLFRLKKHHFCFNGHIVSNIASYSVLTCIQQSIMNLGILMVQGLVNSFGVPVMAAFAAAVKIDSFAYMPVQDFGNAFSTFIAQNYGAGKTERIQGGIRSAIKTAFLFCAVISAGVWFFAPQLMMIFIQPEESQIIAIGTGYLRIEGSCYLGIGCLFLLYGLYRGLGKPGMSVVLTVISLGSRVALAYLLAPIPAIGLTGIWAAIPIGWGLADAAGIMYYLRMSKKGCLLK